MGEKWTRRQLFLAAGSTVAALCLPSYEMPLEVRTYLGNGQPPSSFGTFTWRVIEHCHRVGSYWRILLRRQLEDGGSSTLKGETVAIEGTGDLPAQDLPLGSWHQVRFHEPKISVSDSSHYERALRSNQRRDQQRAS